MGDMSAHINDLDSPFATDSSLPFALPNFAALTTADYEPAIRAGIAAELAEIDAIVAQNDPPTVSNTLDAFETSGQLLARVMSVFDNELSSNTNEELDDLDERLAPVLSAHHDDIYLNDALYSRLRSLEEILRHNDATHGTEHHTSADTEARYLLSTTLRDFVRAGVELSDDKKQQLRTLNEQASTLESAFGRTLLAGTNAAAILVTNETELQGVPDDVRASAAAAARERGHDQGWLLELQLPTVQPILAHVASRTLREKIHRASVNRGLGGEHDTRQILLDLVRVRAEIAQLLGYEHWAAYVAEDSTAGTTPAINDMLTSLVAPAVRNARREAEVLTQALRDELHDDTAHLQPWDWTYLSEKVRARDYQLDDAALRPYLELHRVVHHGVFAAATRLYGITFHQRDDLKGYHNDVVVYEVHNADGSPLGLFLADWYTRDTKRGGAWMNNLVEQSFLLNHHPVVVNNLNITPPPAGQPTLLTWDEVITLFHEFGHALHGLFAQSHYPSHSGTQVPRDFVEFPSQVNEMWAWDPELLHNYAVHYHTGEPLPQQWIDTLIATRQFNEGFATTEYLAAAILDQAWHQRQPHELPTNPADVEAFEHAALTAAGIQLDLVPPRYRSTYFNHIFAGGYSAGYYSYIWSEVLDADTVQWFHDNGGATRANGDHFRTTLLAPGGSANCLSTYRTFRGRDAHREPLLTRRGLLDNN